MTHRKYFGMASYFCALALIALAVWFWVGFWILAVIPHMVFAAFFLSVFVDIGYMYLRGNIDALRFRNDLVSNVSALLLTGAALAVAYWVLG